MGKNCFVVEDELVGEAEGDFLSGFGDILLFGCLLSGNNESRDVPFRAYLELDDLLTVREIA